MSDFRCNSDSKGDYFCRKHECLPSNPRSGRGEKSPDIKFLHNARPEAGEIIIPAPVKEYFTLVNETGLCGQIATKFSQA